MAAALWLAGCGGAPQSTKAPEAVVPEAGPTGVPVDAATAGTIRGVVKLEGTPPQARAINMRSVPACARLHETPPVVEDVVVGDDGGLKNVVVYLQGDFSQYSFPDPPPVTINQQGCIYVPRVVALTTRTTLRVTSSDMTTHNVQALAEENRNWNETQTRGNGAIETVFAHPEVAVRLQCNVHPWMTAWVAVFDHPYFQVTGSDGAFDLTDVPPGTYTVTAWHERYGSREQTVTLPANGDAQVDFAFTADDE